MLIYLIGYYFVLIFSIVFKFLNSEYLNVEFLKEYNNYKLFHYNSVDGKFIFQSILNVISFIPLGFLLLYNIRKPLISVICILLTTVCFEIIQLEFGIGVFDINDIFFNFTGGLIGVVFYFILSKTKK